MSMTFIMLTNVVGILKFISKINNTVHFRVLKQEQSWIFQQFSFNEQSKFHAQLGLALKKFHYLGACLFVNTVLPGFK